jgi:hypothetical protein
VAGIRQPDEDCIPVAAPRPPRAPHTPRRGVEDATGAGLIIIVIIAAFAALGWRLGAWTGLPAAGMILGGFAGLIAGFAAVYWRYKKL